MGKNAVYIWQLNFKAIMHLENRAEKPTAVPKRLHISSSSCLLSVDLMCMCINWNGWLLFGSSEQQCNTLTTPCFRRTWQCLIGAQCCVFDGCHTWNLLSWGEIFGSRVKVCIICKASIYYDYKCSDVSCNYLATYGLTRCVWSVSVCVCDQEKLKRETTR